MRMACFFMSVMPAAKLDMRSALAERKVKLRMNCAVGSSNGRSSFLPTPWPGDKKLILRDVNSPSAVVLAFLMVLM